MAENNDLKVIVGLDIPKSVVEIEGDLKIIEKALAKSDEGKLKITAGLNVGKTIGIINKQLSELKIDGSRLKITPTLDISVGNQMAQQVNDQVNSAFSQINFKHIAREIRDLLNIKKNSGIKEITKDIQTMYESFNVDPDKYKEAFNNILNWYQKRSDDFIFTEEKKVEELNAFLISSYNNPDLITEFSKSYAKYTKDNPLIVTQQTLTEMESILGSIEKVKELFGTIQIDNQHGQTIYSFMEDWDPKEKNNSLATYIQYLQKLQELKERNRLTLDEYTSKDENELLINQIEAAILKYYKFIEVSNRVAQSNEQVAQSEKDVAQAQREVSNSARTVTANGSDDLLKRKGELANQVVSSELRILGLEQQLQTQGQKLADLRVQEANVYPFGDEADQLSRQIQEAQNRYNATKQMLDQENATHTTLNEQMNTILSQIEQEKQRMAQATQNISSSNGNTGTGASANYFSNNANNILAVANSAKEAEDYYKRLLATMGDSKGVVTSTEHLRGAEGELKSFTIAIKAGSGAFEAFNYSINKDGAFDIGSITAANAGIQRLAESAEKFKSTMKAYVKEAQADAKALRTEWNNPNGTKSVQNDENVSKLNEKYLKLIQTIRSLREVDSQSAIEIKGRINAQKTELQSLIKFYHSMEKSATSLRAKNTDSSIVDAQNKVQKFMNEFNGSKVSFTSVQTEMTNLANAFVALGRATDENKVELLHKLLDALGNAQTKFNAENQLVKNFKDLSTEIDHAYTAFKKFDDSSALKNNFKNQDVISFRDTVANLRAEYDKLNAELAQTPKTSDAYKKLRADLDVLSPKLKNAQNAYNELQTRLRSSNGEQLADARLQRLINRINEYMAVNTKAAKKYGSQFQSILSQASIKQDTEGIRRLEMEFASLSSQIKIAGDQGKSFGRMLVDNAKKFTVWFSLTSNIMRAIRTFKQMISTVREIDTAMTALKRVTDETASSYANFLKSVQTRAVELHATMTDLIDQITTWSKLGYGLNEAQNLAQVSMMYSKVGDVDNETAVKDLVATMKAYNMTAEESIRIVDILDVLNNKYAVSAKDLGAGLSRVASAMAVSNTSLEKSLSLITGGAEITQDAENIATALKVINARIRGMKGQLQELGEEYENIESISKIQTQILNLSGVNIFDANRNFRDTYDILEDIAKVYKDLSDEQSSSLLEILFGKNRYNQGVAILQAFESGQIQKALNDATNSVGVATKEWSKYEKSIDASVDSFNAMKQALSSEIFNSQGLKNIVDFGTNALGVLKDIISQFGVIQTLLPIILGSLSAFKNVGRHKMSCLKREYADCGVVVTRNELMQVA